MKKKYTYQPFSPLLGDQMMAYLADMAAKGWKFKGLSNFASLLVFEEAEPEVRHFNWECLPVGLNKKEAVSLENQMIDSHKEEGWTYDLTYGGRMMIFSAKEQLPFSHAAGDWGRLERVFTSAKRGRTRNLIGFFVSLIVMAFAISGLFEKVPSAGGLTWGLVLPGVFNLLAENMTPVILLLALCWLIRSGVSLLGYRRMNRLKTKLEQVLTDKEKIFYGMPEEKYQKARKRTRIFTIFTSILPILALLYLALLSWMNDSPVAFLSNLAIYGIYFVLLLILFSFARKKRWGTARVFLVTFLLAIVVIAGSVQVLLKEDGLTRDVSMKEQMKEFEAEYSYPPSFFGKTDTDSAACFFDKNKNIFGSYESGDFYYMEETEEADLAYSYSIYRPNGKSLYAFLQKQALSNIEPYDPVKMRGLPEGWTGYQIKCDEYDYYSDIFVLFHDGEILVFNCWSWDTSIYEILEKILPSPLKI